MQPTPSSRKFCENLLNGKDLFVRCFIFCTTGWTSTLRHLLRSFSCSRQIAVLVMANKETTKSHTTFAKFARRLDRLHKRLKISSRKLCETCRKVCEEITKSSQKLKAKVAISPTCGKGDSTGRTRGKLLNLCT